MIVTDRHWLWSFISPRVGVPWSDEFRAIGIARDDCLLGCVAYNGFAGRSCFMHIAIDDPSVITRTFVKAVMEYPFIQCDLTEVLALVDSANEKALNFDKRIGFQEVYRLEGAGAVGEDLILLRLRREECKWIRSESNGSNESVAGNASVSAGSADAGRRSQPS